MKKLVLIIGILITNFSAIPIFGAESQKDIARESLDTIIQKIDNHNEFSKSTTNEELQNTITIYLQNSDPVITAEIQKLYKTIYSPITFSQNTAEKTYQKLKDNFTKLSNDLSATVDFSQLKKFTEEIIQALRQKIETIKKSKTLAKEKRFAAELLMHYALNLSSAITKAKNLNQESPQPKLDSKEESSFWLKNPSDPQPSSDYFDPENIDQMEENRIARLKKAGYKEQSRNPKPTPALYPTEQPTTPPLAEQPTQPPIKMPIILLTPFVEQPTMPLAPTMQPIEQPTIPRKNMDQPIPVEPIVTPTIQPQESKIPLPGITPVQQLETKEQRQVPAKRTSTQLQPTTPSVILPEPALVKYPTEQPTTPPLAKQPTNPNILPIEQPTNPLQGQPTIPLTPIMQPIEQPTTPRKNMDQPMPVEPIKTPTIQPQESQIPMPAMPNWKAIANTEAETANKIKENIKQYTRNKIGKNAQTAAQRTLEAAQKALDNARLAKEQPQNALYYAQLIKKFVEEAQKLEKVTYILAETFLKEEQLRRKKEAEKYITKSQELIKLIENLLPKSGIPYEKMTQKQRSATLAKKYAENAEKSAREDNLKMAKMYTNFADYFAKEAQGVLDTIIAKESLRKEIQEDIEIAQKEFSELNKNLKKEKQRLQNNQYLSQEYKQTIFNDMQKEIKNKQIEIQGYQNELASL